MNAHETESELLLATQRASDAQCARQNAQRMRLLAAQRAERLEQELKDAAEIGARAEISRALAARRRLQAVQKNAIDTQTLRRAEQRALQVPVVPMPQPVAGGARAS